MLKFLEVVGNGVENMPVELLGDAAKVSLQLETDEPVEEGPLDGPLLTQEWDRGVAQMTAAAEDHEESTQVFLAYLRKLEPAFLSDTKLDLSGLGLIAVPISMLAFTHLTAVSLANNKISQLPLALAGLHRLCTLDLAGNPGIDFFLPEVLVHEPHRPIELLSRLRAAIGEQTAELSGLRLRLLPACVFELMGLVNLDVKDNEIIALPEDFGSHAAFEGLRSLNVSKNRLRGIPASLGLLTALTALHCSYNDLRSIAPEVALCTSLTSLKLDNNPALDSPPPSVVDAGLEACLSYLKVLLLARYNTTLLLEGRGMRRVPVDLLDYPHLTEVSVAQNAIVDLPQSICSMKTLATLCIAHNQITALPEAIGRMDGLRFLRAEHNRIALVPASFCRLSRLQVCDFSSNLLTWLPNTIGNMNSLSELLVTDNPLRTPPLDIVEQGTFRILRFLRMLGSSESSCSLNLNALGLRTLPLLICRQTALTELKLFKNRISELPLKAGRLTSLTHLVLSSNQLSALPDVVHHWNRMERLYLDDNRLTILPDSICLLLHLKELRAAGNMLEQLPSSIGSLQQLVLIDVARNRLRGLPASISLLTKMQKLRLGGNQFRKIMDELAELQLLEELNVSDNLLLDLPPDLCNLYNLSFLHAEGNERLFSPPPEIRRKGLADMMKYLRRVLNARETMVLDLAWLGLKNLYLDPDRLSGLTTLNLSGNAFEDLPEQIPNLTCLKTLTFDENRLRVLPPGLGAITSLTKLSFKGNPVESPPEEVIDRGTEAILIYLRRLWDSRLTEKLDLSSQGIETLHVSVCHLTALTELTLDKNRCKTIPFEIEGLSRLTYLSIRDNLLEVLPSTLGRLVNISVLLLDNNPTMPALPSEMCGLHCLTTFGFSGNEFLSPGMEICSKGVTAMLAYLSAVHQSIVSKKIELQSFGMLGFAADLVARPTVISIDVSNNYLESMNNGFFFLVNLQHIDISFNRLREIPSLIGNLRDLQSFTADGNAIESLPASMAYIESLLSISVAENKIAVIPDDFENSTMLQSLNLACNRLTVLLPSLSQAIGLTKLNLSRNEITSLPGEWGLLTNLTEIDITSNPIEYPPLDVRRKGLDFMLRFLRRVKDCFVSNILDLTNLNLEDVRSILSKNLNLVELHLDRNRIRLLHSNIGKLRHLQVLSITENEITVLPPELGNCTKLQVLRMDIDKILSPPSDILREGIHFILKYLQTLYSARYSGVLDLSGSRHTEFPLEILGITGLKQLSLKNNRLQEVPPAIVIMSSLEHLDLSGNGITTIPHELGKMTALTFLSLENNPIRSLPRELRYLTNLEHLLIRSIDLQSPPVPLHTAPASVVLRYLNAIEEGIRSNRLVLESFSLFEIPEEVLLLTSLTSLSVRNNSITIIPLEFGDMTEIQEFDADNNNIVNITPVIWQLTRLARLSLANNKMQYIPEEMGIMSPETLADLNLEGCSRLESPPPEIVRKGASNILNYLSRIFLARQSLELQLNSLELEVFSFIHFGHHVAIKTLFLQSNKLQILPEDMCSRMTALEQLMVDHNVMEGLPMASGDFMSIRIISASWNKLKHLPDSLCNLRTLLQLIISNNEISALPDHIGDLCALEIFDASVNILASLPSSITALENLKLLNVNDNRLVLFPRNCSNMLSLEILNVSENRISYLDEELGLLPNIRIVDSAHNPLSTPPEEVAMAGGLKFCEYIRNLRMSRQSSVLRLEGMNLSHFPPPLFNLSHLSILSVSSNQIPAVPFQLFEVMRMLTDLDLSLNRIVDIPSSISLLASLKNLNLDRNDLLELPPTITELTNLCDLSCANNMIGVLPLQLALMTKLERLCAVGNDLNCPPCEVVSQGVTKIRQFFQLQLAIKEEYGIPGPTEGRGRLDLSGWSISFLDKSLHNICSQLRALICRDNLMVLLPQDIGTLVNLSVLDIGCNRFESIPMQTFQLTGLSELYADNNKIQSIPPSINALKLLQALDLGHNQVSAIPLQMCTLDLLQKLVLDSNLLQILPDELGNLSSLTILSLSNNNLCALPSSLKALRALVSLSIGGNKIHALPNEWVHFFSLQHLDLSYDKFSKVPNCIFTYNSLTNLDLRENQISQLPSELFNLSKLVKLELYGNSISDPPVEILRLGFAQVLPPLISTAFNC